MRVVWAGVLLSALGIGCFLGCGKASPPPPSIAEKKVLDSLDCPAVAVTNGQAALLKLEKGYGLFVPHIDNRYEGKYELVYSASGDFKNDAVSIQKGSGRFSDQNVTIKGHRLNVYGESERSVWVQLAFGDKKLLIALLPTSNPKDLDLSKIRFEPTSDADSATWAQFLREKGLIR
jgi:hypothetical protein